MDTLFVLGVVAVILITIVVSIRRSHELFVLDVGGGRVKLRRGRLPRRLLNDLEEVVKRAAIERGRISVVREGERPLVVAPTLKDDQLQQLRNVVGMYPLAKIRSGARQA